MSDKATGECVKFLAKKSPTEHPDGWVAWIFRQEDGALVGFELHGLTDKEVGRHLEHSGQLPSEFEQGWLKPLAQLSPEVREHFRA
jgi:hypothetical protein